MKPELERDLFGLELVNIHDFSYPSFTLDETFVPPHLIGFHNRFTDNNSNSFKSMNDGVECFLMIQPRSRDITNATTIRLTEEVDSNPGFFSLGRLLDQH